MKTSVRLRVNGVERSLLIDPRVSLLDLLRDHLRLTGTKKGCSQGACGACTVLVDGERINSCLALAIQYEDREIQTIEGLSETGLHPMQEAFIEHDGFQCGYCTPGRDLFCDGDAVRIHTRRAKRGDRGRNASRVDRGRVARTHER